MLQDFYQPNVLEAGCDEAGRGCLAGPVFAAAVILPAQFNIPLLNDSKKLTDAQRVSLKAAIEAQAICFAVASSSHIVIDKINILNASIKAMHLALSKLAKTPAHIIVDGNRFKPFGCIPHTTIIKGDAKFKSIAAASILAKTYRDDYMRQLAKKFPHYEWQQNKGYPTLAHKKLIESYGLSPYHRTTFRWQIIAKPTLFD
jgi:ribonuclease HII